ncbi:NB-ARC domain-containing protein [Kamptonema formosum]|uniref:NB-ARC domain-containing protein n=1 Tax=Kamptonema formosum TaxID=331992 RepID=UPI000347992A|nr:NB-ARC domain-containing protein [Oscillatoria sp. PCC 10802]
MESPPNPNEEFADASNHWDLQRLYADLASAKQEVASRPTRGLTAVEKLHLCGLLCGCSPAEIARRLHKDARGVEAELSATLYRYIKTLTGKKLNSWQDIVPWLEAAGYRKSSPQRYYDWEKAPDVSLFYGRTGELAALKQWVVGDKCRLVAIYGTGGIGKTSLAAKLAQQIQNEFECVIWRSLSNAPPRAQLLASLLGFLSDRQPPQTTLSDLLDFLRTHRTLVILDGVENLMAAGQFVGKYREGYQDYTELFKVAGLSDHISCFLLASTEKSREIAIWEGNRNPVRSLQLKGLEKPAAWEILRERDLVEEAEWANLIDRYGGHPLALRIVAATIKDVFANKSSVFLRETTFLGDIREVLAQQFQRLSELEKKVMYQLALSREPVSRTGLREGISSYVSCEELTEALKSLGWRSLIETVTEDGEALFTLLPAVRKYVINQNS